MPRLAANISIHAAYEGSNTKQHTVFDVACKFQSTLPTKAVTRIPCHQGYCHSISIHAAYEGSNCGKGCGNLNGEVISIHAAYEGSNKQGKSLSVMLSISIHAAYEGSNICKKE